MSFCGITSTPSFTPDEMRQTYADGLLPETLPNMSSGLATDTDIESRIQTLKNQTKIPELPTGPYPSTPFSSPDRINPLKKFKEDEKTLQDNLKAEYCYYESRYLAALNSLLNAIADNSLGANANTIITNRLNLTIQLNNKLTYLTQLANALTQDRYLTASSLQTSNNTILKEMEERQARLLSQQKTLTSETAAVDLHKRMAEYTAEKAKANTNLLSLYFVLNLTALAMIYYVART